MQVSYLIRRAALLLLLVSLFLTMAAPAMASGAGSFGDVSGSAWYYSAVDFVTRRGLFQGTSDGVFSPNVGMTRAMFITVLGRYAGVDAGSWVGGHAFSDVPSGSYYAGYAAWAYERGIIEGDGSSDVFSPNKSITREQVCTILARFASAMGISLGGSSSVSFTDDGSISGWARDSVYALSRAGIVQGRDTGAFDPRGCASRAEAAAIIQRFDAAPSGGVQPPSGQQGGQTTPPSTEKEPSAPPATGGVLANASLVSHLSQGDRACCLATSFSMAANLILGYNQYGPFDWTASGSDSLSVPGGTSFQGTDGRTYSPVWGGSSLDSLRAAIDSALGSNCPIIISVNNASTSGTHYVLAIGWADESHSECLIVDPSGGGDGMLDSAMPMSAKNYSLGNRDGTYACISFQAS